MLKNTEFTVIIDHSALLYILNTKTEPPTANLETHYFKMKFMRDKDMAISDFYQGIQAMIKLLQIKQFQFPFESENCLKMQTNWIIS